MDKLERQLAMAKPEVTAFKAYFDMLQQAYKRAIQGLGQLEEEDKGRMTNALRLQLKNWEAGL